MSDLINIGDSEDTSKIQYKDQAGAVTNPPAGFHRTYSRADGFYILDSDGVETGPFIDTGGGGGGGGGGGSDTTAIHDDTAGEIAAITEKVSPVSADLILIEDSADGNEKKRVQIGNLPTGGGGGGTDPTHATLWADEFTPVGGTTLSVNADPDQFYGFYISNPTNTDGDAFEITFTMAAGTYTLSALGNAFANRGILDYAVDGANVLTGQDWYVAGAAQFNIVKTGSVTILTDGLHTLRITVNGKNGSGSGFLCVLTKLWIK